MTVSRDDLIAAVREASAAEAGDAGSSHGADAQPADLDVPPVGHDPVNDNAVPVDDPGAANDVGGPAPANTVSNLDVPEEPRVAALLRAREKALAERQAARSEAESLLEEARAQAQRMLDDARAQAASLQTAAASNWKKRFSEAPTEVLRELGEPQEIVDAVLKEGTPEARELARIRRELAEIKSTAKTAEQIRQEFQAYREAQQQEAQQRQIEQVRATFLSDHANAEKAPHLNMRYDADEIFDRANRVAASWRDSGLQIGKDFDYDDVVQYLEIESKRRLSGASNAPSAVRGTVGKAATPPATRTLTAAQGSERRASPRPFREMSREEQRQALIDEVAAVRRANPSTLT